MFSIRAWGFLRSLCVLDGLQSLSILYIPSQTKKKKKKERNQVSISENQSALKMASRRTFNLTGGIISSHSHHPCARYKKNGKKEKPIFSKGNTILHFLMVFWSVIWDKMDTLYPDWDCTQVMNFFKPRIFFWKENKQSSKWDLSKNLFSQPVRCKFKNISFSGNSVVQK